MPYDLHAAAHSIHNTAQRRYVDALVDVIDKAQARACAQAAASATRAG